MTKPQDKPLREHWCEVHKERYLRACASCLVQGIDALIHGYETHTREWMEPPISWMEECIYEWVKEDLEELLETAGAPGDGEEQ